MDITLNTSLGTLRGNSFGNYNEYLGVRFATAERFRYAQPVEKWDGIYDATKPGGVCPQRRWWAEHLEMPERLFYHKEFREGIDFRYDEDCLNLNLYTPKAGEKLPVIVFIYGGGFECGANSESPFDGAQLARRGVITVFISYRVGMLGYLTHEQLKAENGREGNFGLDDQLTALRWVKAHIADFGGDPENITVMGQSAGAISIQYLCLNEQCKGLFKRAFMLSGAGLFPKFSLPRPAESTRDYWLGFMAFAGIPSLEALKEADIFELGLKLDAYRATRKDNVYNTMPVIDGCLLTAPVDELIQKPLAIDYMVGCTNNDMYSIIMWHIGRKYIRQNKGYMYCFDIDAPGGKNNGAFHSADLRYVFGTLDRSWRQYSPADYAVSEMLLDYIANFARTGDPNGPGLPKWKRGRAALIIGKKTRMGYMSRAKLLWNTLTKGDPT